jgi:hypothetical protein
MRKIKSNKKGIMQEMLALVVVGIICAVFFAGWYYSTNVVNGVLTSGNLDKVIGVTTNSMGDDGHLSQTSSNFTVNVSQASYATYSQVNTGYSLLGFLAAMIFVSFMIGTLLMAYFAPGHPLLIFAYIMVTIAMTIFSFYISNAYMALERTSGIGAILQSWSMITFFMENLPYMIAITGFSGCAISFIRYFGGSSQPY